MITLLHEYTHHFLISSQRYAMPRWISEGAAEFYSSAQFMSDGGVSVGRPNKMRGYELMYEQNISMEELLDDELYAKRNSKRYDSFYGQAWLLYHYLVFSTDRKGQLNAYMQAIAAGTPSLEAAKTVFGDLKKLGSELDTYLRARRVWVFNVRAEAVAPGPIAVSRIGAPLAAMLPVLVRSRPGGDSEGAAAVLVDARKIASRYPGDAQVQAALAEAEFDAGNDDEAIAAANRAIAIDPQVENAYVQKGYALFRKAADADDQDRAYRDAMAPFQALNAIENDHPLPLIYYYRSYVARGQEPSDNARDALARASELAPFDFGLAFQTGAMFAAEGRPGLAIQVLKPVAANPHGGQMAEMARAFIDQLATTPEGTIVHYSGAVDTEADDEDAAAP
jgi:tetratricopeptide (TPR) repeat protein